MCVCVSETESVCVCDCKIVSQKESTFIKILFDFSITERRVNLIYLTSLNIDFLNVESSRAYLIAEI